MALMWRRRSRARRHRDLLGRVRAPQVGPDTTLLITDVQNSTVLWEALPVTTMDCALRAHNACIRQTLAKYDGYESATEGDSFIVAFASPASATAFAVSCQLALLEADWPQELLQHPDGAMVLVEPRDPAITWGAAPPPLVPTPPLPGHAPRSGATTLAAGASAGTLQLPNAGVQALTIAGGSFPPQAPSMAVSSPHGWGVGGLLRWSAALTAHSRHCCSSSQIQLQPVCSPQSRRPSWNNVQHILTTAAFNYGGARVTTPGSAYGAAATGAATTTTTTTVATTTAATTAATTTAATATTAMAAATCSRFLDTSPQTAAPQSLALASPFSSPPPPMIMLLQQPPLITQSVSTRAVCAAAATTGAPPARVFTSCTSTGMATSETPPRLTFNELLPTGSPAAAILTARESANGGGGPGGSCISFRGGKVSAPPCLSEHQNFPIPPARDFPSQPPDGTAAAAAAVAAEFTTTTAGPALKVYNRLEALQHDSGDDLMASSGLVSLNNANSANLDSSTSDGGAWCTWQELLTATFPIVQAFAAAMSPGAMAATDGAMGTESSAAASVRLTRDRDQACVRLVDGRIVAFRGLRVRMGLHSGLDNPNHVFFNRVSSSYHYSGEFAEVTRLVSDSAPGGLVVMSGLAFGRLRHCVEQGGWGGCGGGGSGGLKAGGGRGSIAMKDIKVIYAGHHLLKAGGGGGIGHGIVSACGCRGAGVGTGAISTCGFGDGSSSMNDGLCAYACRASDRIPSYMSRPFTLSPLGRKVSGRTLSPGMSGMYDPPSNTALYGSCICGDSAAVAAGIHTQSVGIGRGGGGGGSVAAATSIAGPSTLLATHSLPIEADESQLVEPDDCPAASSYFNRQEVPITAPITTRLEAPAAVFPLAASTTSLVATSTTPHALALRQDTPMPRSPSGHVVRQETPTAQRSPLSRWLAPQPLQQLSPVTALLMAPGPPPQLQAHDAPIGARLTKDLRSSVWSRKLKRFFPGYSYMPTKPDGTWHGTPPTLPQPLYVAVPSGLLCRLALVPPLRSRWVSQLSSLDAPTGLITVAFLKVVGASTLLAELPGGVAVEALGQCQRLVVSRLGAAGGYLVEGCGDGLVLAAFGSPTAAVEWALDCLEGLRRLDWDPALLAHELCAEHMESILPVIKPSQGSVRTLTTAGAASSTPANADAAPVAGAQSGEVPAASRTITNNNGVGSGALDRIHQGNQPIRSSWADAPRRGVGVSGASQLVRGLRIKVGLAIGVASHSLNETSGRLSYRGKLMNRAARLVGVASGGQVLCSLSVWEACEAADPIDFPGRVCGTFLGPVQLKGIREPLHVVQCTREMTAGEMTITSPA
ncbi:hypothetical protein Vafri_5901 [Volvox africanus]|nr:hypothetical protein Vafri_5901 [Volvox africanus]